MNPAAIIGTVLAIGGVILGLVLEGGHLGQLIQGTAALIVFGGTLGAVLLAYPWADVRRAFGAVPTVYRAAPVRDLEPLVREIARVAGVARKEGVLAIEGTRSSIQDAFFRQSVKFVIDGLDAAMVREILEAEIELAREMDENAAKVLEGAGGIAPAVGILGAILGLIHVMSMLNEPSRIGEGIAVAFVAAIYGMGAANLLLIPWSTRMKRMARDRQVAKELVRIGVSGIQDGLNPHFIEERLKVYIENVRSAR